MGKGLMVKPTGVHVAFAAGTGVLVFIDLVAQLALVNLGNLDTLDREQFKLHLYVSFPNRKQAVGLELFEALQKYCEKKGLINFELHLRLS